jgi:hypothetical protein
MEYVRRTALVALVWLTAASTLVAGLPHFDCICPNGRRKPVCFNITDKKTGCCCGGSCCPPNGQAKEGTVQGKGRGGCCCCCRGGQDARPDGSEPTRNKTGAAPRHEGQSVKGTADDALQLARTRCVRTLAHSDEMTPALNKAGAKGSASLEPLALPAAHSTLAPSPAAVPPRDSWLLSHAPPPTDLVITLLHLVI